MAHLCFRRADNPKTLESHTAEANRLGIDRKALGRRSALASISAIVLQHECANAFLDGFCNKTESNGGTCEVYYEKHRGDETPYSKCKASDPLEGSYTALPDETPLDVDSVLAQPDPTLAVQQTAGTTIVNSDDVTANLKVYQSDVEVAGLFVLPDVELLVSFKLLAPLARVDICTGRNYADLHRRQSFLLSSRKRFKRQQRLHTSDGDKAQSLAEWVLDHRAVADGEMTVPTFRSQCQAHRVYHVFTAGTALFTNFVTGQIRMTLSLRGPGVYQKFKRMLWT